MRNSSYIRLLRPHQYVKNLFIFAPLLFSFDSSPQHIINTIIAFTLFCLTASAVYILNDIHDIEEDRKHPTKKNRPLASGAITVKQAITFMGTFAVIALVGSFLFNLSLFAILMVYILLNIAYSLKLKHIPIVDIFIIATGFVLRIFAGAIVVSVTPSMWIILMTFLLALFLSLAKRRDDVKLSFQDLQTRKNINSYNLEFINAAMILMAGVIIISYILYTVSEEIIQRLGTQYLYLTSFFVILGIMRYMQITFVEEASGSPTEIVLKDRFLQLTILLWLFSFFGVCYI